MAVAQSMKWAAVVKGLRQKGLSDKVIAEYSLTTEENIGLIAKARMDPAPATAMMLRRMEFKVRKVAKIPYIPAPKPVAATLPVDPAVPRDVYESPVPAEGYRHWEVVTARGLLAIELRVHKSFVGRRDIARGLRAWLNEEDRILEIIHGDGSA